MNAQAGFRFHHYGLAAADPAAAAAFATKLGYVCGPVLFDPLQDVHLRWCEHAMSAPLEIVSPASPDGPLKRILAEQPSSFYHLCYEIPGDTATALAALRADGTRVATVVAPIPAVLFGGRRVSFHMVRNFGLLELLEPTLDQSGRAM